MERKRRTRRVWWKDSSRLRIESGGGKNIWGRKGSNHLWMDKEGDIDGKDFKDSFCVKHTHTWTLCYRSFMKDKIKLGNVFIYFYFPLGLPSRDWAMGEPEQWDITTYDTTYNCIQFPCPTPTLYLPAIQENRRIWLPLLKLIF